VDHGQKTSLARARRLIAYICRVYSLTPAELLAQGHERRRAEGLSPNALAHAVSRLM